LIDARTQDLIHELRRQNCGNWDHGTCCGHAEKRAKPCASDEVLIHIFEKKEDATRAAGGAEGALVTTAARPLTLC